MSRIMLGGIELPADLQWVDEFTGWRTQPLAAIELVVGVNSAHALGDRRNPWLPLRAMCGCQNVAERQRDVAAGHFEQTLDTCPALLGSR